MTFQLKLCFWVKTEQLLFLLHVKFYHETMQHLLISKVIQNDNKQFLVCDAHLAFGVNIRGIL